MGMRRCRDHKRTRSFGLVDGSAERGHQRITRETGGHRGWQGEALRSFGGRKARRNVFFDEPVGIILWAADRLGSSVCRWDVEVDSWELHSRPIIGIEIEELRTPPQAADATQASSAGPLGPPMNGDLHFWTLGAGAPLEALVAEPACF